MLRALFMGTPEFAVPALEQLHGVAQIVGVCTQPDRKQGRNLALTPPPVKVCAERLGLTVLQPERVSRDVESLRRLAPDLIVVVAYGQLLSQAVLDVPKHGCFNLHASLLPRWRGAAPVQYAIWAGDAETGVCAQRMVAALDAGDVVLSRATPIGARETSGELMQRLSKLGGELIPELLVMVEGGTLVSRPQDPSHVTLAPKLGREHERLDPWQHSAVELDRQVRAFSPWPGTSVWVSGERLKIRAAAPLERAPLAQIAAGTLFASAGMLCLATRMGALQLLRVQQEGRREVEASEFVRAGGGTWSRLPLAIDPIPGVG